ncbi:MAG TPA: helix-turn-helix domain-containing protein [Pseudobdellovibrionaceae bacterium]|nr:helix-turn-helix domain-containing protein [Pseudobdellovibrionaceae bacterium]
MISQAESMQDIEVGLESFRDAEINVGSPTPFSTPLTAKSSLRLKYEAEVMVLRRKIGGLEEIRARLGLSSRKMAQLLMVDPSAWTRWVQGGDSAPPHIWRALAWYLALEEKYPGLDHQFWLSSVSRPQSEDLALAAQRSLRNEAQSLREELHSQLQKFNVEQLRVRELERRRSLRNMILGSIGGILLFMAGHLLAKFGA